MKKTVLAAALATALFACNSGDNNESNDDIHVDAESKNVTPGIRNANGNIPDTTNAMELSSHDSIVFRERDSLARLGSDTIRRKSRKK